MKRYITLTLALALALTLVSCGASAAGDQSEDTRKGQDIAATLADSAASFQPEGSQPEELDHDHQPAQGDNILPHDDVGYCGNTITTISSGPLAEGEGWEASFWGSDSVALTDLLRYLDYSGDMCKCAPEYSVKTEFSEESYGISLSGGYARHGGGQAELTQEQIDLIQGILDRNRPD